MVHSRGPVLQILQVLADTKTYRPAHILCSRRGMLCRPVGTAHDSPAGSLYLVAVGQSAYDCPQVSYPATKTVVHMVHPRRASLLLPGGRLALSDSH